MAEETRGLDTLVARLAFVAVGFGLGTLAGYSYAKISFGRQAEIRQAEYDAVKRYAQDLHNSQDNFMRMMAESVGATSTTTVNPTPDYGR